MKLHPLYEKVFVRRADSKLSAGGIVIPDSAQGLNDRTFTGTVVAVGPGRLLPPAVSVGDTVIAPRYQYRDNNGVEHPADITITGPEGETLYVVREPDLYALVEK
jgi:co-chaperonin GroES (HSP10)